MPTMATLKNRILIFLIVWIAVLFLGVMNVAPADANGGPHGNYTAATDACAGCHRSHTGNAAKLLPSPADDNAMCLTCHNSTGAVPVPIVSTHGNTAFSERAEELFALSCTQCHDPHGSNTNLFSIKNYVLVQNGASPLTTGPITFTATTGTNSFDDGVSTPASRICVTCHNTAANPGYPMTGHVGGANHNGNNDFIGQDCIVCHTHSADTDFNTQDGFMPSAGCTICHASPQGIRRAVVNEFGYTSHHVQGQVTDSDCKVCHSLQSHESGTIYLNNVDVPGTSYTYNPADPSTLEPFCLACHDANGAGGVAPFSDGQMPLVIDGAVWPTTTHGANATCYDCHDNGHGTNNNFMLKANYVISDYNGYASGDYQLCWSCHIENKIMNQRNAFNNLHDKHVKGEDAPCILCHNAHAPYDNGETGLINFEYGIQNGYDIQYINGRDASTSFWISGNMGYCYLRCHGKNHTPKKYSRSNDTITTQRILPDIDTIIKLYLPIVMNNAQTSTVTQKTNPNSDPMLKVYLPIVMKGSRP